MSAAPTGSTPSPSSKYPIDAAAATSGKAKEGEPTTTDADETASTHSVASEILGTGKSDAPPPLKRTDSATLRAQAFSQHLERGKSDELVKDVKAALNVSSSEYIGLRDQTQVAGQEGKSSGLMDRIRNMGTGIKEKGTEMYLKFTYEKGLLDMVKATTNPNTTVEQREKLQEQSKKAVEELCKPMTEGKQMSDAELYTRTKLINLHLAFQEHNQTKIHGAGAEASVKEFDPSKEGSLHDAHTQIQKELETKGPDAEAAIKAQRKQLMIIALNAANKIFFGIEDVVEYHGRINKPAGVNSSQYPNYRVEEGFGNRIVTKLKVPDEKYFEAYKEIDRLRAENEPLLKAYQKDSSTYTHEDFSPADFGKQLTAHKHNLVKLQLEGIEMTSSGDLAAANVALDKMLGELKNDPNLKEMVIKKRAELLDVVFSKKKMDDRNAELNELGKLETAPADKKEYLKRLEGDKAALSSMLNDVRADIEKLPKPPTTKSKDAAVIKKDKDLYHAKLAFLNELEKKCEDKLNSVKAEIGKQQGVKSVFGKVTAGVSNLAKTSDSTRESTIKKLSERVKAQNPDRDSIKADIMKEITALNAEIYSADPPSRERYNTLIGFKTQLEALSATNDQAAKAKK